MALKPRLSDQARRLAKARIDLIFDEPFFGSLILQLKMVETKNVKTFCTDTVHLFWNPDFAATLSHKEIKTILAHEALHCALLHPFRMGEREHRQFNTAADYAINNYLVAYNEAEKARERPAPFDISKGLVNPAFDDLSAEEIYTRIAQPPPPGEGKPDPNGTQGDPGDGQGQPDPNSQGQPGNQPGKNGQPTSDDGQSPGEFVEAPGTEAETNEQEARWRVALNQAASAARQQGKLPSEMARLVEELLNPSIPWEQVLRDFVKDRCQDDYSWTRPNPRYLHTGFILPSLYSQRLGTIAVAVDTSGSIDEDLLKKFMGEIQGIMDSCRPTKLILIDCDAQVHAVREFAAGEQVAMDFTGGGGTDFRPVFTRLLDEPEIAALVYLTDLAGDFPDAEPPYPVLWASTDKDRQAPFGVTLPLE